MKRLFQVKREQLDKMRLLLDTSHLALEEEEI